MVAGRDHVGAGRLKLGGDLGGEAKTAGGVLAIDDHEVGADLFLQSGEDCLDRVATGMADDVGDEQYAKVVKHQVNLRRR